MKKILSVILALVMAASLCVFAFAEDIEYTVKKGDTLSGIASKYNTTVKDIVDKNDAIKSENSTIYEGQKIIVPKDSRDVVVNDGYIHHKVVSGDNLTNIAKKYSTTVSAIVALNPDKLTKGDKTVLQIGWDLKVAKTDGTDPTPVDDPPVVDPTPVTPTIPNLIAPAHEFFSDEISVSFKNADVRDALSTVAALSGKQILYIGDKQTITFKASGTVKSVLDALCKAGTDLGFIISGNTAVVGPKTVVSAADTFAYKTFSKIITVKNLDAASLKKILDYLKLPEYTFEISTKDSHICAVTSTPYGLATVLSAISSIDRADNIVGGNFSWQRIGLDNITAAQFAEYATYVGLGGHIIPSADTNAVFITGDSDTVALFTRLKSLTDKGDAVTFAKYPFLSNASSATLIDLAQYTAQFFTVNSVYLVGSKAEVDKLYSYLEYTRTN